MSSLGLRASSNRRPVFEHSEFIGGDGLTIGSTLLDLDPEFRRGFCGHLVRLLNINWKTASIISTVDRIEWIESNRIDRSTHPFEQNTRLRVAELV